MTTNHPQWLFTANEGSIMGVLHGTEARFVILSQQGFHIETQTVSEDLTETGIPQLTAKAVLILELELELIQTRMIQKQLLWVEVGKSACVLVGICELRLSLPARYDTQCPSLLDFLSGCLVRVLWIVGLRHILYGMLNRPRPVIELSSF
jgi:hypothetical protein